MRVLILSAFLAYAVAAPSGVIAPYYYQPIAYSATLPTVSPGDIQGAVIDAQVKVNDLARAAADNAQLNADQAVENENEKVLTDVDQVNERNLEVFWSNEEKKWQAIDAVKTAEAQIDGVAASNAELYAKTDIGGVVPYVAADAPVLSVAPAANVAPVVGAPVVYNPYFSALKTISTKTVEVKAEEKKEENQAVTVEAAIKSAKPEKAEKVEEPAMKSADKPVEAPTADAEKNHLVLANPWIAPIPSIYRYNIVPAVGPVLVQPFVKYASYPTVHRAVAPAFVQSVL